MENKKRQILLTNDDGIRSPGLWAAAAALSSLGYVHVAAPRDQYSGAGRSLPSNTDGIIRMEEVNVSGQGWPVYSVGGSPAQAVLHAVLEILPKRPELVVSGINYGENVGSGVTISGTVGAALEGASFGIPSLAVSLQTAPEYHRSHSTEVDFSAAAFFAQKFARLLLDLPRPADVDVLKVEIPEGATPQTPWRDKAHIGYQRMIEPDRLEPDSDVRALVEGVISVTPLSLDMTSRVDLSEMARLLQRNGLDQA